MIYICIPSHNEERTVGILLWKIRQVLTAFPRDYELLVLDDASTDATREVLAPYARILPLTVLRHAERRGYAASLDELLREAVRRSEYPRRDVILTLQADFTEDPDDIPTLLKRIESGADIVTTRTSIAREHASRTVRWIRAAAGRLLRRLDWPEAVTDVLSGMRAYRVIGVKKALEEHGEARLAEWVDPWAANAALLRAVKPHVRRVDEIEVTLRPDRRQRDSRFDPWANARALARMAFRRPPLHAAPARRGPATVVTAAELAAAARAAPPPPPAEPARRGRRGARERPATRADVAPRKKIGAGAETTRGERGDRGDRGESERSEKSARGEKPRTGRGSRDRADRADRADVARDPTTRRSRTERPSPSADPRGDGSQAVPGAEAGRTGRRGRRGRGGAAAAAAATEESRPLDALAADGALAEVLGPDLVESLDALSAEGTEPGGSTERKSRRRRSSRRGRGRRVSAEGAAEGTTEGMPDPMGTPDVESVQGLLDLGNGKLSPAGSEDVLSTAVETEGGEPSSSQEVVGGVEGAPASRPKRRARRGGRGRSRGRRGGGNADAAGPVGEGGEDGGEMTGGDAPVAGPAADRPVAPPSEVDFAPAHEHRETSSSALFEGRPFVPQLPPPRPETPTASAPEPEPRPPAEPNTTGPTEG